jgi:hypothetical protein
MGPFFFRRAFQQQQQRAGPNVSHDLSLSFFLSHTHTQKLKKLKKKKVKER